MAKENETALDAVNAAIDSLAQPADANAEEPEEAEETAPEADAEEIPAEGAAAEEAPAEGEAAAEEPPAATKPAEEPPKPAAKEPDPINDPIPPQVSERTRSRITALVAGTKDRDTKLAEKDAVIAEQQELYKAIEATGATPEEFGNMLQYMKLINSDSLDDQRAAFGVMVSELKVLAAKLGETIPGTDALEGHPDLTAAVAAGQLTLQHAHELAATRTRTKAATLHTQTRTAAQRQQDEAAQAVATARDELTALGNHLAATDPNYKAKYDIVVPLLRPIMAQLPPSKWKSAFTQAYANVKVAAPVAAPAAVPPANKQQPLRANKQPSGGSTRAPTSMAEAINGGLDAAIRR